MKKVAIIQFLFLFAIGVNVQTPATWPRVPQQTKADTTKSSSSKIYTSANVDKPPEFPRGQDAFFRLISKNLKWPKDSEDAMGRVIISFVVERNGRLSNFKVERSLGTDIDVEAIRVLKLSPKWTPGLKNGYRVRVRYFVPINFEYTN